MNARQPLYTGPTANPCADAEAWNDEQEAAEAFLQRAHDEAPDILIRKLASLKGGDWGKRTLPGCTSPDELLAAAVDEDDDSRDAFYELLQLPQARKLVEAAAHHFCRKNAAAIYQDWLESLA